MHLYIDIGNTALKWRARSAQQVVAGGGPHRRDWAEQIAEIVRRLPCEPVAVTVASVAGRDIDLSLSAMMHDALGVRPDFYYSPAADAGVTNSYAEPARLGVDRWLAIVEAWHRTGAAIVIDCGSALTIDAVDRDGVHSGGFIVPGLNMLQSSLVSGTGAIRVDNPGEDNLRPGVSTSECVRHGILRMSVAFITDAVVALQEAVHDTCPVFITGGDARVLLPFLRPNVQAVPDLVLDGLERVAAQRQ